MQRSDQPVRYLSAAEVWRLHLRVAAQAAALGKPFLSRVIDQGVLEAVVNQPRQTFGGAELYPTVFEKAAALTRGIICDHVFVDGNKRTGLLAAAVFLRYNGYLFHLSDDEMVALALDIAGNKALGRSPIEVAHIAERLKKASEPVGGH